MKRLTLIATLAVFGLVWLAAGPPDGSDNYANFLPTGNMDPSPITFFQVTDADPDYNGPPLPTSDSQSSDAQTIVDNNDALVNLSFEFNSKEWAELLDSSLMYTEDPNYITGAWTPWRNGQDVNGKGGVYCTGEDLAKTRLVIAIQRHKGLWVWTNVNGWNSGWRTNDAIIATIRGDCAAGTHTYRVVVDGWGMDDDGNYDHSTSTSSSARITC